MRGDCVFQSWFGTGLLTRVDLSAPPQFLLIAQTVRQGRKKSRAPGDLILSLSDMRNLDHPSERKCILCIFLTIKLFRHFNALKIKPIFNYESFLPHPPSTYSLKTPVCSTTSLTPGTKLSESLVRGHMVPLGGWGGDKTTV